MHSLAVNKLGLDAAREAATKKIHEIRFDSTDLDEPKEGEHDANNQPHQGGNRWAGGVRSSLHI
jgi:von Willebrand factor A domain-containing protein 8